MLKLRPRLVLTSVALTLASVSLVEAAEKRVAPTRTTRRTLPAPSPAPSPEPTYGAEYTTIPSSTSPHQVSAFTLRPFIGLNFYSVSYSPLAAGQEVNGGTGFNFGVLGEYVFTPTLGFETGILNNGNSVELKSSTAQADLSFRSWEFPFLLRYHATPEFSLGGGLYFESFNGGTYETGGTSFDFEWKKSGQVGLKLGTRYSLPMASAPLSGIFFDLGYKLGLSSRTTSTSTSTYKDRALALSVGAEFGL
jgi:hypothetical protein